MVKEGMSMAKRSLPIEILMAAPQDQDRHFEFLGKLRRLMILSNRLQLIGDPNWYSTWRAYIFQTALGPRKVVDSRYYRPTSTAPMTLSKPDLIHEIVYEDADSGEILFIFTYDPYSVLVKSYIDITPEQAWLAIHELEVLSAEICKEKVKDE